MKGAFPPETLLSSRVPRNPNYPHEFSRKASEFAAPWPDFVPGAAGESYKEFSAQLPNRQGLKRADCSFWSKYIQALKDAGSGALGDENLGVVLELVPNDELCVGFYRMCGGHQVTEYWRHHSPFS